MRRSARVRQKDGGVTFGQSTGERRAGRGREDQTRHRRRLSSQRRHCLFDGCQIRQAPPEVEARSVCPDALLAEKPEVTRHQFLGRRARQHVDTRSESVDQPSDVHLQHREIGGVDWQEPFVVAEGAEGTRLRVLHANVMVLVTGWTGDAPNRIRLLQRPDAQTVARRRCDAPPRPPTRTKSRAPAARVDGKEGRSSRSGTVSVRE